MKATEKYIVTLSGILLVFFLIALICFIFNNSKNLFYYLFIAQLVVFSLAACSVIIYLTMPPSRKVSVSTQELTKIVLLSEANEPAEEFSLISRISVLIGKSGELFINLENDSLADVCAVLNRVENCWYIERVSDSESAGLKRAGEQYVYKLKQGMCYRIHNNDMLYIGRERLLLI